MQTFLPAEDLSQFGIDHGYGLGLERYAMDGMTVIGHMGTGETGSSYVGYDAETGTTVAVTTNTAIAGPSAIIRAGGRRRGRGHGRGTGGSSAGRRSTAARRRGHAEGSQRIGRDGGTRARGVGDALD